ncbi:MAG: PaaI family thioesterase [Rhodospirillaceae bacterium]|jgi:uncharacterized protein (TIGR00369 family)|nr:PaaI family thioesterase [Rhodospirillaceae bacterium]MBT3491969.1 PaaI family thioesterase [Rhodospirillaceae bacterium]MBT3780348.1 PaaI family thioesterase [Rhodospirillaceae bacterium]MBT3977497.1 PaaI family thioesterase [Rhodospirillaceae bacterium]MBT4169777.1 PaaI family thioesterase [Rhodospirillaceae bacterium]
MSPPGANDLALQHQQHQQRQQRRDRGPVAELLGHRLLAIDRAASAIDAEFRAQAHFFNPMGVMQGGFTMAMLEQALLDAVVALMGEPCRATTLEMQCNFLAGIGPGVLRCRASLVRQGRSTAFLEARLFDSGGTLAATATSVVAVSQAGNGQGGQ